jgi:hypothetical protein
VDENELLRATGATPEGKTRSVSEEIYERIVEAMNRPSDTPVDMDPGRLLAILQGQRTPTSLDIALIADACKVPVWWLITGEVEEPSQESVQAANPDWELKGPPIVAITINTRKPDKWRFLDTETGETWRWMDGRFKLVGRADVDPAS